MKKGNDKLIFIILILIVAVIAGYFYMNRGIVRSVKGIPDPIQKDAKGSVEKKVGGYDITITFKNSYDISALVVHDCDYNGGSIDDLLAPKDVALAWGPVAEYNDQIDFNWDQSGRWYYWYVNDASVLGPVGGADGVNLHSANNHLIPADENTKEKVKRLKQGDYIRIQGYLVDVDGTDSSGGTFYWYSSTTREDTGNGSCEIIYVTSVEWLD